VKKAHVDSWIISISCLLGHVTMPLKFLENIGRTYIKFLNNLISLVKWLPAFASQGLG
jgi:hypothetical protein